MAAWRYEISLLMLKKYFIRSLRSLVKYISTLEEKFRISAWPCNILYMFPKYGLYGNHMIQRFAKLHKTVVFELCFNNGP